MAPEDDAPRPSGPSGLEITEDMGFQRRFWRAQRVGWGVIALLLVAAALGLFSRGPLSSATAGGRVGGLEVEYERFQRFGAASALRIEAWARPEDEGRVLLRLAPGLTDALEIETITPWPITAARGREGLVLAMRAAGEVAVVDIRAKPTRIGRLRGEISCAGCAPVRLSAFVYP